MKKIHFKSVSSLIMLPLVIGLFFTSCKKDDGPMDPPVIEEQTIFGKWEITNGRFILSNASYVHINEDNTINILGEDALGFKTNFDTNITVTENQLTTSSGYGSQINNYVLNGNLLVITPPGGAGEISLTRNPNIPAPSEWIKTLAVLAEGDAPWEGDVDIAFNGTQILYGTENGGGQIGLVNPETFALDGTIPTSRSAYAVEVENYDNPNKYIFQSDNGSNKFFAYNEATNTQAFESDATGAWIYGLASVNSDEIWVSSGNARALYLYRYDGVDEILETINLDFQPRGMDYQNGFLYVNDGNRIHKCQTSPTFRAVETYRLQNHNASGIAFDGSNFWLSTYNSGNYKLVKVDL